MPTLRERRSAAPTCRSLLAVARHLLQALDLAAVRLQVRTNTVAGPGADAAIVRIKETGTSIAMSLDGNGRYCYLSPREGAKLASPNAAAISPPSAR